MFRIVPTAQTIFENIFYLALVKDLNKIIFKQ